MIEPTLVPCFVCGKQLDRVHDDFEMHPYGAVLCRTDGNYGSRVLDSGISDREMVVFLVCDDCLIERADRTRQRIVEKTTVTSYAPWPPEPISWPMEGDVNLTTP